MITISKADIQDKTHPCQSVTITEKELLKTHETKKDYLASQSVSCHKSVARQMCAMAHFCITIQKHK